MARTECLDEVLNIKLSVSAAIRLSAVNMFCLTRSYR